MSEGYFKLLIYAFGIAAGLLHTGLRQRKILQIAIDTPTSQLRSSHIGDNVEIEGEVVDPFKDKKYSIVSNRTYSVSVTGIHALDRKHSPKIATLFSPAYLYIKDHTNHLAAVALLDSEWLHAKRFKLKFNNKTFKKVSPALKKILLEKNILDIKTGKFSFSKSYMAVEYILEEKQWVHVTGSSAPPLKNPKCSDNGKHIFIDQSDDQFITKHKDQVKTFITKTHEAKSLFKIGLPRINFEPTRIHVGPESKLRKKLRYQSALLIISGLIFLATAFTMLFNWVLK